MICVLNAEPVLQELPLEDAHPYAIMRVKKDNFHTPSCRQGTLL